MSPADTSSWYDNPWNRLAVSEQRYIYSLARASSLLAGYEPEAAMLLECYESACARLDIDAEYLLGLIRESLAPFLPPS